MSSADWNAISDGSGAYAIIADPTAPTPPDVMSVISGGQDFQNITGGTFKDSRISAWMRPSTYSAGNLRLILRSQDTTFEENPAKYFVSKISAASSTNISVVMQAIYNGSTTTFFSGQIASINGDPIDWNQYQFSCLNSGSDILLRLSQWNGSNFIPIVDGAASIATFPLLDAVGSGRFGGQITTGGQRVLISDVNFYSLT